MTHDQLHLLRRRDRRELAAMPEPARDLTDAQYRELLAVRTTLRRFLRWSEEQARAEGLTPAQHQLLLAVRGHLDPRGPTIGDVAEALLVRHHSAVGLIDRAEDLGVVRRIADSDDERVVRLELTEQGARMLRRLSSSHLSELRRLRAAGPLI